MEGLIKKFLDYLLRETAASINTIDAYRSDLSLFAQFCSSQGVTLGALDKATILAYRDELKRIRYADSTIARRFVALNSFFAYLKNQGIIKANPMEGIQRPSTAKVYPQALTRTEVARLLVMPGRSSKPKAIRDSAMLELLYSTGSRITELVDLDVEMINLAPENPYIRVTHRGATRQITIPPRAVQALRQYVDEVRPEWLGEKEEKALFLNRWGGRLTRAGAWLILQGYAKKAELEGKVTPRTLRSSFAAHQLESGMPLEELQQRLGHAYPGTTSRYRGIL